MVERQRNDISDGFRWRCQRCKTSKSIRDGSFFAKSKLSLQKWLILIFWWSQQYPVKDAQRVAEVDKGTAVDVYRWLREICTTKLLPMPMILGGPGVVVQIDEYLSAKGRLFPESNFNFSYIILATESQRKVHHHGGMGIWYGGYISVSSSGVHGSCQFTRCCHPSSYHSGAYGSRDHHTF